MAWNCTDNLVLQQDTIAELSHNGWHMISKASEGKHYILHFCSNVFFFSVFFFFNHINFHIYLHGMQFVKCMVQANGSPFAKQTSKLPCCSAVRVLPTSTTIPEVGDDLLCRFCQVFRPLHHLLISCLVNMQGFTEYVGDVFC